MEEGAGNTFEEHSTLPTFPCNNIDLSFGCSISPALWAEGTVQDSNHCQGREEEISKEWWCPPAGAHSEQTGLHTLNTGMAMDEVVTSEWEEEAKGREEPNRNKKSCDSYRGYPLEKQNNAKLKKKKNLLKAYFSFKLFAVVNRNPTNPFLWEQYLFMSAVRLKQGGADQVSKDAYMQKGCQSQTVLSKYPTFRNTNDSSL